MTRILLIRHGATDLLGRVLYGRMPGVHLNAHGNSQAVALARALVSRYSLSAIVSSPRERALETARPLSQAASLTIDIDGAFDEIEFGDWVGLSFEELQHDPLWRQYCERRATTRPPRGESMMDVQSRAWTGIANILERFRDAADPVIALVTHGDVIRSLLVLLLGMSLDHIHRIEASPGSVSELRIHHATVMVSTMNETFSLTEVSDS